MLSFKDLPSERRQELTTKLIEQCSGDPELSSNLIMCVAYAFAMKGGTRELWLSKCTMEFDRVKDQLDRVRGRAG